MSSIERQDLLNTSTPIEATVSSVAVKGMGGGTATSFLGWITSNEAMAVIGLIVTLSGFIINVIFQVRRDRREAELHRSHIATLKESDKGNS